MLHDRVVRYCRLAITLLLLVLVWMALSQALWPSAALAQGTPPASSALPATTPTLQPSPLIPPPSTTLPAVWYLFAAGLALLVPAGFVLLAVANLEPQNSWNTALGGLAAAGLAAFAYWAVGFALQFGGIGLVYPHAELRGLVWEWSPLSSEWGIGWGMAGLTGWFLSGATVTALAYTLFMAHLPWVLLAAILPVMALRGRAPSTVTLILALVLGGIVYPLAGNWVQGGGWLNALGRNLELGHGFVDFGGAGSVHLVAAGFGLAALAVWSVRRSARTPADAPPPAHQPLLAVVGALLIMGGGIGWQFSNPLQVETLGTIGMMRGAVSSVLAAAGGMLFPLLYTWFVTGSSEPTMAARGFAAGAVAGLAVGPFVQPGIAFVTGLLAGATVPFVTYVLDGRLRLHDRTGLIISSGVPALVGLLFVGIFADGVAGSGWQMTGAGSYLGVTGQGVAGLMAASGYAPDFPSQIQAQIVGITALGLWGFLAGLVVCVPLGLLFHSLTHRQEAPVRAAPVLSPTATQTVYPVAAPALVPTPVTATQTAEIVRPPFPPDPFAAPLAPAQAYAEPARPPQRTEFLPAYTPVEPAPTPAPVEPPYPAEPFTPAPYAYVPREGYWPDASPPPTPADPYQSLEPETPPSTAALLDSTLDSLTTQAAPPASPAVDPTTTDTPVAVPVSSQPFIGGSPLLRRRKPPDTPGRKP